MVWMCSVGRGALLQGIAKGAKLKKTVTVDKSGQCTISSWPLPHADRHHYLEQLHHMHMSHLFLLRIYANKMDQLHKSQETRMLWEGWCVLYCLCRGSGGFAHAHTYTFLELATIANLHWRILS